MARKQFLQNVRTTREYSPEVIAQAELKYGEIAVFQNTKKPSLGIKVGENTYAQFKDSEAVTNEINSAKTELSTTIGQNTADISELSKKIEGYATSANTVAADEKVLSSAKTYTDLLKAKEGETYNGETLAGLKSEINSLKSGSETTVEGLTTRVAQAEKDIDALEDKVGDNTKGLVKDVADLKTTVGNSTTGLVKNVADLNTKIDAVSGASSAYTDSQINAIKGDSYKTGTTLASLESNLETERGRIDAILQDAPTGLTSFKDVETKITNAITAAYKYQGSVDNYSDLPENVTTIGFVYNVKNAVGNIGDKNYTPAGTNYAWNGTEWDALGGTVDLSTYATKTDVNNALTGVTGTGSNSIVTRLRTAETNIENLQQSASTLNTDVQTIKGWKINDKFISGSPILNGTDIKVDATSAQTLKEAIAAAKTAGDNAMTYATGVSGSVKTLTDTVNKKLGDIDAYTVNEIPISESPVLTGENILVGGKSENSAKTLNATIAEAKQAGTEAQDNLNTLSGTLKTLSDKVDVNEQNITTINGTLATASSRANSAIQRITIKANADAGVTISDPKGDDGAKTQELDFSKIVIDCGEF